MVGHDTSRAKAITNKLCVGPVWEGETCGCRDRCPPNGEGAKLRGQGPRAEAVAARRLPAF
jgi:hypothetical protein